MIGRTALLSAALCGLCLSDTLSPRLNNGVGTTPALGFNNWNMGGTSTSTAATALSIANAFVNLGLKDAGYTYVNIDDGWSLMSRNSSGFLVPDPKKWPNGIKPIADQIHAMGLKIGLYGDSGTATCAGYPGSQGYETKDAETLAAWGVDYWKYDNCNTPSTNSSTRYTKMRDALLATRKPILFSMCQWGTDSVWTWAASVGNSWRVTGDITNNWNSVASIAASSAAITSYSAPGGFNDYDMMEIGNRVLTEAEERAHFGLWAICKSPIILGTNISSLSASSLKIVKNKAVLAINQDRLGKAASVFRPSGQAAPGKGLYPYWAGPLSDGVVIGLVAVDSATTLSVKLADVPGLGSGTYKWTELYSGATGSGTSVSAKLALHDMAIFKVTT